MKSIRPWVTGMVTADLNWGSLSSPHAVENIVHETEASMAGSGRVLVRFSGFERLVHWMTASCFVVLALSGLNITFGRPLLLPLIGPEVSGGSFCPFDGHVNSLRTFRAFHTAMKQLGVDYFPERPVASIALTRIYSVSGAGGVPPVGPP